MTDELDDSVQEKIDQFCAHLRESMTHMIGQPIKPERLQEAAKTIFDQWAHSEKLLQPDRDFLMPALEVSFGLRDPMDLIQILSEFSTTRLERIYQQYGPGPANIFGLVYFGRQGDLKYEVTEHRPGFLGMTVTPKMPMKYITLTITLEDPEGS